MILNTHCASEYKLNNAENSHAISICALVLSGLMMIWFDYRNERVDRINFINNVDDMVWRNTSRHIVNQSLIISKLTSLNQLALFSCNKHAQTLFGIKSSASFNDFLTRVSLSLGQCIFNSRLFDALPFKRSVANLRDYLLARHFKMLQDNARPLQKKPSPLNENLSKRLLIFFQQLYNQIRYWRDKPSQETRRNMKQTIQDSQEEDHGFINNAHSLQKMGNFLDLLDNAPSSSPDVDFLYSNTEVEGVMKEFRISIFKYTGGPSGEKSPLLILCIEEIKKNDFDNLKKEILESRNFIFNALSFFAQQMKTQMNYLNKHQTLAKQSNSVIKPQAIQSKLEHICHKSKRVALRSLIQVSNYSDCYRHKEHKAFPLEITSFSISELILQAIYFNKQPELIYDSDHQFIRSDERRLIQVIFNILNFFSTKKRVRFIVMDRARYDALNNQLQLPIQAKENSMHNKTEHINCAMNDNKSQIPSSNQLPSNSITSCNIPSEYTPTYAQSPKKRINFRQNIPIQKYAEKGEEIRKDFEIKRVESCRGETPSIRDQIETERGELLLPIGQFPPLSPILTVIGEKEKIIAEVENYDSLQKKRNNDIIFSTHDKVNKTTDLIQRDTQILDADQIQKNEQEDFRECENIDQQSNSILQKLVYFEHHASKSENQFKNNGLQDINKQKSNESYLNENINKKNVDSNQYYINQDNVIFSNMSQEKHKNNLINSNLSKDLILPHIHEKRVPREITNHYYSQRAQSMNEKGIYSEVHRHTAEFINVIPQKQHNQPQQTQLEQQSLQNNYLPEMNDLLFHNRKPQSGPLNQMVESQNNVSPQKIDNLKTPNKRFRKKNKKLNESCSNSKNVPNIYPSLSQRSLGFSENICFSEKRKPIQNDNFTRLLGKKQDEIAIEIQIEGDQAQFDANNSTFQMLATNEIVKLLGPNKKIQIKPNGIYFYLYTNLDQCDLNANLFAGCEPFEEFFDLKTLINPKDAKQIQRKERAITIDINSRKTKQSSSEHLQNLIQKEKILNQIPYRLNSVPENFNTVMRDVFESNNKKDTSRKKSGDTLQIYEKGNPVKQKQISMSIGHYSHDNIIYNQDNFARSYSTQKLGSNQTQFRKWKKSNGDKISENGNISFDSNVPSIHEICSSPFFHSNELASHIDSKFKENSQKQSAYYQLKSRINHYQLTQQQITSVFESNNIVNNAPNFIGDYQTSKTNDKITSNQMNHFQIEVIPLKH